MSAIVVCGANCVIIWRIRAIVGPVLDGERSTPDIEVVNILEKVALPGHQGVGRRAEFCSRKSSGGKTAIREPQGAKYILYIYMWGAVLIFLLNAQMRENKSICKY